MLTINLLFIPINSTEIDFEKIKTRLDKAKFTGKVCFDISKLDEPIEIPTEMDRAAPWHVCPVTEEITDISNSHCYSLNYCLMYMIDEVEKLLKENSDTDYVVFLFPKSPTRDGGFVSFEKKCVCVENNIENIIDKLSNLTNCIEGRENF